MIRYLLICLITVLILILANGCFFGTFQTAETLGAGKVGSTAYIMIPTYAYSDSTMDDFVEAMSAGGFFQIGATDNFDVGLILSAAGIGAQGKLRLTPGVTSSRSGSSSRRSISRRGRRRSSSYNPFNAAGIFSINYDLWRGGLVPKGDLLASVRFSEYFSIYSGGQIFYAPKLTDTKLDREVNRQIYVGFNVRRSEKVTPQMQWIPTSLYIEFGYPLDLEKKTFMFGIGIGGANLPALFGSCLGAMGD